MTGWSEERVETLKKLWADGLSCSLIAARLGGITRSAVIGKVHRLGLSGRAPTSQLKSGRRAGVKQIRRPRLQVVYQPKVVTTRSGPKPLLPEPLPSPQPLDVARVTFADLEPHHCRFVPFEPEKGFCGLPKVLGRSYCEHHLERCTIPSRYVSRLRQAHEMVEHGTQTTAAAAEEFLEPA